MRIEELRIGMQVQHQQYGIGTIEAISKNTTDVLFDFGRKIIAPESNSLRPYAESIEISELKEPLETFITRTVDKVVSRLGLETKSFDDILLNRWSGGKMVLEPNNSELKSKEVDIEVFFHKIVMMRNNLRVLEQKINAHPKLSEAEKVEMQSYITKCYGSMTTFNILFREQDDQF